MFNLYIFDMGGVVSRNTNVAPDMAAHLEFDGTKMIDFAREDFGRGVCPKIFLQKRSHRRRWAARQILRTRAGSGCRGDYRHLEKRRPGCGRYQYDRPSLRDTSAKGGLPNLRCGLCIASDRAGQTGPGLLHLHFGARGLSGGSNRFHRRGSGQR